MSENQIGFLFKAATFVFKENSNKTQNILKSYYLMRCKEITRGYGLPQKHFSVNARCPECCIEWQDTTETRVKSMRLSKKQRRKIRLRQNNTVKFSKDDILGKNKLEKICSFCKHITSLSVVNPHKNKFIASDQINNKKAITGKKIEKKVQINPETTTNVYCQSSEVFSLLNQNNTVDSKTVKEKPKITNCKKKKDKFAGLCQRAVLSANRLKHEKEKQNKINLFLKPS